MIFFSRALAFLGGLFVFLGGFVMPGGHESRVFAATFENISAAESIDSSVLSFQTISALRKQNPVDADALLLEYETGMQSLTQQVDEQAGLRLDSDVLAAIENVRDDKDPDLAVQVIDKTLQRVFFQTIIDRITAVRDDFDDQTTAELVAQWDEASAAFEAIKGTAARENKVITTDRQTIQTADNPGLDVEITNAFLRGRTALNKENSDEDKITVAIERQNIRLSLARAYYIGVLREIDGILSNREREPNVAREKQKEGEIFYRIIEEFIVRDNPTGNLLIKDQLIGNLSDVVADQLTSELSKGLIGRVRAELSANEESLGDDRARAKEVAEEALLYANIFLADLAVRLGQQSQDDLLSALTNLKSASDTGDANTAGNARQSIETILVNYEDELALSHYVKTNTTDFLDPAILSFQAIGVLRKQSPIDADAILAEYEGELRVLTRFMDEVYGASMDDDLLLAMNNIRNDNQPKLAAQVIDKTLQRVFALTIYNRVTLVQDNFDQLSINELQFEWDRAYAAFLSIIGTAARENKVLSDDRLTIETGDNPDLDNRIELAFVNGKNALNQEDAAVDKVNLAIAREEIVLSLVRTFFIGVLREIEGIVDNREREIEKAWEKQEEGEFFYRIVEGFVLQDNPSGNAFINSQLTGNVADVNADRLVSEINRGLIGQLNRHLQLSQTSIESDRDLARRAAVAASLYAEMFLADLAQRLDSLQRVRLENALRDLKDAVDTGNEVNAQEANQQIGTILALYEAQLL